MAVDALEYNDEETNPAGAVEEILEAPERLKDLDLDAFAEELQRQVSRAFGFLIFPRISTKRTPQFLARHSILT